MFGMRRKWQPTPVFLPGESQAEEPSGLQSMGSHRVGHDWSDLAAATAAAAVFPNLSLVVKPSSSGLLFAGSLFVCLFLITDSISPLMIFSNYLFSWLSLGRLYYF